LRGSWMPARWSAVRADRTVHVTPKIYENPTETGSAEVNLVDLRQRM
jgi:hypothetical protein